MKAYVLKKYGKDEKFELEDVTLVDPKANEVLVEIHAASLNQLDSKVKSGAFKLTMPYKFPLLLGYDFAGIVIKTGAKVDKFKIGDEVFARASSPGTFAQSICVNQSDVALKPKNISMEEAASIPLVGLTAWQAFVEKAKLLKGQKVFIQAGSGGVGTFAIQLAKHLGAIVATTTSEKNSELVRELGANIVVDYKAQDFESILNDYDLVLHSQDDKTLEKSFRILRSGGQIISISGPPDVEMAKEQNLSWIFKFVLYLMSRKVKKQAKKLEVKYSFLFMKPSGNQLLEISKLISNGEIRAVVDKVYPFDHINEAMEYLESGRAKGKVVLKMK